MREKIFNMRLTSEEWARFEAVAKHHNLPVASTLRMLVKREADAVVRRGSRQRSREPGRGRIVTTKLVRWACPNEEYGHAAVLAPSKPRKDDVRRYCLECSRATGRLVRRVAPVLVRAREVAVEKANARTEKRIAKVEAKSAAYYTVAGLDLREELRIMLRASAVKGKLRDIRPPTLRVRRPKLRPGTYGRCYWSKNLILIVDYPGITAHDVRETLAHELAHMASPGKGHSVAWKTTFRLLCEEVLGVRPRVDRRFHGEVTRALKERDAADASEKGLVP